MKECVVEFNLSERRDRVVDGGTAGQAQRTVWARDLEEVVTKEAVRARVR